MIALYGGPLSGRYATCERKAPGTTVRVCGWSYVVQPGGYAVWAYPALGLSHVFLDEVS